MNGNSLVSVLRRPNRGEMLSVRRLVVILVVTGALVLTGFAVQQSKGATVVGAPRSSTTSAVTAQAPASNWTNLTYGSSPSVRTQYAMAYDAADHEVVLFGGISADGTVLNDTWVYSNGTWTNITASAGPGPSPRYGAAMTYDAADGYVLLVDGMGAYQTITDTWEFSAGHWKAILNRSSSAPYFEDPEGLLAYDSSTGYSVMLGGYEYAAGNWTYVGFNYSTNKTNPEPTGCGSLVDYPPYHGVLCVGGSTWLFNGTWTNISSTINGSPPVHLWPAATYDPIAQTLVLFGGGQYVRNPATGQLSYHDLSDTWALKNSTWWNVSTSPSPPPDNQATLVWDAEDNMTLIFGGLGNNPRVAASYNFTWTWGTHPILVDVLPAAVPSPVDVGASVTFSVSFLGGVPPYFFHWQFGDGGVSASRSPVHSYTSPGNYTAVVWVNDSSNHSGRGRMSIRVIQGITINLSNTPNPTDVGLPVSLGTNPSGGVGNSSTEWSFGDGTRGNGSRTTHTFGSRGNYSIHAWVNDTGGGSVTATGVEHVNAALGVPTINASPSSPSLGQLVNFSASETGGTLPYTFSWQFGDGGIGGNLTNISHIFTTNGPFSAAVTVRDSAGASMTSYLRLTVALNLSILGNASAGAAPLVVGFRSEVAGGTPGYTYLWKFGDGGRSSLTDPSHDYAVPGTYTTSLTVTDAAGHSAQADWSLFVASGGGGPLAVGLVASPASFTLGNSTLVTASLSGGLGAYSWTWSSSTSTCVLAGMFVERCTPVQSGSTVISLTVVDSTGHRFAASTQIQVLGSGYTHLISPGKQSAGWGTSFGLLGIVLTIAGLATAGVVIVVARRARENPEPKVRDGQAKTFSSFQVAGAPPEPSAESRTRPRSERTSDSEETPFSGMV